MLSVDLLAGVVKVDPSGSVTVQECLKTASPVPLIVTDSSLYLVDKGYVILDMRYNLQNLLEPIDNPQVKVVPGNKETFTVKEAAENCV